MTSASSTNLRIELKTLGHATLLVSEGGVPLIATDPWIIGSTYWRSWWLEKYPTSDEIGLIRRSKYVYVTHSHPDHFHWPSLRHLGPRKMLSPRFPDYAVPDFLRRNSYPCQVLEPFQWYELTPSVRICSIPVPIDDSILVIETPNAVVVDLNDSFARPSICRAMHDHSSGRMTKKRP